MENKTTSENVLIEHYKELNNTARHYDYQFWLIPGANLTLSSVFYALAFSSNVNSLSRIFLLIIPIVFGAFFLLQMINERAYQKINKCRISILRIELGLETTNNKDENVSQVKSWHYWWEQQVKAPRISLILMSLILLIQTGMLFINLK